VSAEPTVPGARGAGTVLPVAAGRRTLARFVAVVRMLWPAWARRTAAWIGRFAMRPAGLLSGFGAIHAGVVLAFLPTILAGRTLGDLPLYRQWAEAAVRGFPPVLHGDWVYPAGALVPIVLAIIAGPAAYLAVWTALVAAANLGAIWALTRGFRQPSGYRAAWYWLAIVAILSPVAMLRLEGFAAPLAIMGLVLVARRPAVSGALLAAATWVKIWPAAVLMAAFTASSRRWRIVVGAAAATFVVVAIVSLGGGAKHLLSFLGVQDDRALQLEAPVSTLWVWLAVGHVPGARIYDNPVLATREVRGPGADLAADVVGVAMIVVCALITVALITARRRLSRLGAVEGRPASSPFLESRLLVLGAFAVTSALVVFDKVGSPQYMLWLAPIVAVGLAIDPIRWRLPAWWMAGVGVATTLIFPIFYIWLILAYPWAAALLTVRNAMLVAFFVWACVELSRCAADPARLARSRGRVRLTPRQREEADETVPDATGPLRSIA